ncbi:siderophore-interacting protein [Brevibacterium salitolerans]|uniref:Siderophore-interacting protein n=2 Tax=Brevibacterium TaxID=1696 RepID=A0ABP5HXN9_9MICO
MSTLLTDGIPGTTGAGRFAELSPAVPRPAFRTPHEAMRESARTATYRFTPRARVLTVVGAAQLSANLKRVRFRADDDFAEFPFISPDDHLKLIFDTDAAGEPVLPEFSGGQWSPRGTVHRDFTVRWFDPQARTLDIDFVLGTHGVAAHWAAEAAPGDRLGALGPRGAYLVKDDVYDWYLLAADESALPALARWVESLPEGTPVTAYVEVQDAASHIDLPTRADLTVHWLHRGDAAPGTTTMLADAVMRHTLPDRSGYVWAAGEALSVKSLRCHLMFREGLPRDSWSVDGYWRRGRADYERLEPIPCARCEAEAAR